MNMNYEQLVELITQEVIRTVGKTESCTNNNPSSNEKALLVGDGKSVPIEAKSKYNLLPIENYKGNIEDFDAVIIGSISLTQLADIALGRDSSAESCAVLKALLSGKKVFLIESGLPHRKYAGEGSRQLFKMYEGYTNTIITFGAVMVRETKKANANCNAFADNTADRVITEAIARQLAEKDGNIVRLCKGTILTPSAKDIFNHSDKTVEFI